MREHRPPSTLCRAGVALLGAGLLTVAVACGGDDAEDTATTVAPGATPSTTTAPEVPWLADAQAVLDASVGPDGLRFVDGPDEVPNPAQGATLGIRLPDGTRQVLTTGTDIDGEPVDPAGTFTVSYLTRTVVEMLAWELEEAGEIDLAAPIAEWAPQVPGAEEITLQMIIDRTAGLGDSNDALFSALLAEPDRAWDLAEAVDVVAAVPAAVPPGTFRWETQEVGPGIIFGFVIEEATGRSLDELLEEYVTGPLGLESMVFGNPDTAASEGGTFILESEILRTDDPSSPVTPFLTIAKPSWSLQSDMSDLLEAFGALVDGSLPGPGQAPAPSSFPADRFVAERDLGFGVDTPLVAYCPCTGEGQDRAYSSYGRTGVNAGTSITAVTFPDTGISLAVRFNASGTEGPDMRRVLYEIHDLINAA